MSITLNQVATHAKDMLREATGDTIATSLMEEYVKMTYYDWCEEIQWPEEELTFDTVADTQEYNLDPRVIAIFRIYVNGQRIPPTSIPLLEGDVQGKYDATWTVLPSITVPALTSGSLSLVPITAAGAYGRMQYYVRPKVTLGTNIGVIGFVPKPAAIYPVKVQAAVVPAEPATGTTLVFPDRFKDGLAFGGIYRFLLGDRRGDEASGWKSLENEQFAKAAKWRRTLAGGEGQLPVVIPHDYRGFYDLRRKTNVIG